MPIQASCVKNDCGEAWVEYRWASDLKFMFSVSLCVFSEKSSRVHSQKRAVVLHRKRKIILPFNIFLSRSLGVELYFHRILCSQKNIICGWLFGRAYHLVISTKVFDVAISANVIPAWHRTPRKQPSQSQSLLFIKQPIFFQKKITYVMWLFQVWLYYTLLVSERSGKTQEWKEHSINIQIIIFA